MRHAAQRQRSDHRCVIPTKRASVLTENNWLRSWSNDLYLWYDEIVDRDPVAVYDVGLFRPAENDRDDAVGRGEGSVPLHDADEPVGSVVAVGRTRRATARRGRSSHRTPPRQIVVAYTDPGHAGDEPVPVNLARGATVLQVDGVDAVNDATQANVDAINAGLFPANTGENHTFVVMDPGRGIAHHHDDVGRRSRRRRCRTCRRLPPARRRSATSCSTITSPTPSRS